MKYNRRFISFIILGSFIALCMICISPLIALAVDGPGTVRIQADSDDVVTGSGDTFTLSVYAYCGAQTITGVESFLTFDPALLQVTTAPTLGAGWSGAFNNTYSNVAGTIEVDPYNFGGVSGTMTVYNVGFTVQHDSGTAAMVLVEPASFPPGDPQVTFADNFGNPNVTGEINGAGYRIVGPVDPLPVAPVPEIVTIVLITFGLLAIGGFLWDRKRRKVYSPATS